MIPIVKPTHRVARGWKNVASRGGVALVGVSLLVGACTPQPRPLPEVPAEPPAKKPLASQGATLDLDWSYQGPSGPEHWAELDARWKACAEPGQSPIDLPLDGLVPPPSPPRPSASSPPANPQHPKAEETQVEPSENEPAPAVAHPPTLMERLSNAKLAPRFGRLTLEAKSDGRVVTLRGAMSQGLTIDGKLATLERIVLHQPSEHRMGGSTPSLEMVFWLYEKKLGRLALSLLFRKGSPNPALDALIEHVPSAGSYENQLLGAEMDLARLVPEGVKMLAYLGSETTPPCAGSIPRLIVAHVGELSAQQLDALLVGLPSGSARPVQPLEGRPVSVLNLGAAAGASPSPSSTKASPPTQAESAKE